MAIGTEYHVRFRQSDGIIATRSYRDGFNETDPHQLLKNHRFFLMIPDDAEIQEVITTEYVFDDEKSHTNRLYRIDFIEKPYSRLVMILKNIVSRDPLTMEDALHIQPFIPDNGELYAVHLME